VQAGSCSCLRDLWVLSSIQGIYAITNQSSVSILTCTPMLSARRTSRTARFPLTFSTLILPFYTQNSTSRQNSKLWISLISSFSQQLTKLNKKNSSLSFTSVLTPLEKKKSSYILQKSSALLSLSVKIATKTFLSLDSILTSSPQILLQALYMQLLSEICMSISQKLKNPWVLCSQDGQVNLIFVPLGSTPFLTVYIPATLSSVLLLIV
jgi:hypothetical protein